MDRPIIFSAPMVRALLDGRKTQTRRILKPSPGMQSKWLTMDLLHRAPTCYLAEVDGCLGVQMQHPLAGTDGVNPMSPLTWVRLSYAPGDRLWVREAFATWDGGARDLIYRADTSDNEWADMLHDRRHAAPWRVRPSIHMPRWASRLTLHVTKVRVQRLQEISEMDAFCEGVAQRTDAHCRDDFADLWNSLHGPDAWGANPWVCAVSFTVERANIDEARP